MRRPQSAKPGHRILHVKSTMNESKDEEEYSRNLSRKQVKIIKPQLTTHDFGRIMPKNIYQDKERLYSDALTLKKAMNQISQQNVKLKTRISILEREKDKMNKYIQTVTESTHKTQSRLKVVSGQNKGPDKQNMMVRNLKKIVRNTKDQNQYLKQQLIKIKKNIKYTRLHQLEIQRTIFQEENIKLNHVLNELNEQLYSQEQYEKENQELKAYLEEEIEVNKQLSESNEKYLEYIDELETKIQKETEKASEKQKKLQRDLALQRRRFNETIKEVDSLKRQLKQVNEKNKKTIQKSQPRSVIHKPTDNRKQIEEVKTRNQRLLSELEQTKLQLKKSQAKLQQVEEKKRIDMQRHSSEKDEEKEIKIQYSQDNYSEEFDEESPSKNETKKIIEEDEEVQPLYQRQKKKKDKKYKINKKIMSEIKQILTYRMKAQRYPYAELEKDIHASNETQFTSHDLQQMMKAQPFFLSQHYTNAFLQFVFQREKINDTLSIDNETFLLKIRKIIDDFQLFQEEEEEEMLLRIAQMTTTYQSELQIAFEKIKNGAETVPKDKLVEMFKKLQLDDHYISIIISELSLCSDDLDHLNFYGFFQRFLIEGVSQGHQQIDEEHEQQSRSDNNVTGHRISPGEQIEDGNLNIDDDPVVMEGRQSEQMMEEGIDVKEGM